MWEGERERGMHYFSVCFLIASSCNKSPGLFVFLLNFFTTTTLMVFIVVVNKTK